MKFGSSDWRGFLACLITGCWKIQQRHEWMNEWMNDYGRGSGGGLLQTKRITAFMCICSGEKYLASHSHLSFKNLNCWSEIQNIFFTPSDLLKWYSACLFPFLLHSFFQSLTGIAECAQTGETSCTRDASRYYFDQRLIFFFCSSSIRRFNCCSVAAFCPRYTVLPLCCRRRRSLAYLCRHKWEDQTQLFWQCQMWEDGFSRIYRTHFVPD